MQSKTSWRQAFTSSPGPRTAKAAVVLFLKGLCMGAADIVPGVSGGTIAFITGIYDDLLSAIRSFGRDFFYAFFTLKWKAALTQSHLRFIIVLLFGILVALVSLAQVIHYFLLEQPVYTAAFFFGLVLASVLVVGKKIDKWTPAAWLAFISGLVCATVLVNLIPIDTPYGLWFIFLCGVIGICAMILPGISGAFILLILGKYTYLTGILKDPLHAYNLLVIAVFGAGCVVGLMAFSRILGYFLKHHRRCTLAFLTGLVLAAVQKIWPWQTSAADGMLLTHLTLPASFSGEVLAVAGLAIIGFVLVIGLEKLANANHIRNEAL